MGGQGGGVVVNVGSTAGIRPRPGLTWYNATKGAVNLATRSLAVELAPQKILRVNCVAPVMGATGLLESFMGVPDTPENRARFIAPSLSAAFRSRRTWPMPASISPPTRPSSSPASCWKWDGGRTI